MTDDAPSDDHIENRVDDLEAQVADIDPEDLRERMGSIETQHAELRKHIDLLARHVRSESEDIPDVKSVEGLYRDLEQLDGEMTRIRERLRELTEGVSPDDGEGSEPTRSNERT